MPRHDVVLTVATLHKWHVLVGFTVLNICGIKFSRFTENDILAHFNFGVHDIPWLQIEKKSGVN